MIILSWLDQEGELCYMSTGDEDFKNEEEALAEFRVVLDHSGNSHVRLWSTDPTPHIIRQTDDMRESPL